MESILKTAHHTDWLLPVIVFVFILLALLRRRHYARFREFLQLPFHPRRKELEEDFKPNWRSGNFEIALSLFSYLVLGLALFVAVRHHEAGQSFSDWQMYLRITFVVAIFFVLKNMAGLVVGWIFHCSEAIAESQNTHLAYRCWFSIFLFPLSVLAVFWNGLGLWGYAIILLILGLGYLIALQFTAVRLWRIPARAYYKIFYLCALEITPLFFMVTWLKSLY